MRKSSLCLVIVIAALTSVLFIVPAHGATVVGSAVVNPGNGDIYELLSNDNWTNSEAAAQQLGGHLATIRDQADQNFVFNTFGGYGGSQHLLWIGLNDAAVEGQFVWSDGEALAYTNWDPGEPNNANGNEDYVAMYYPNFHNPGSWNDWSNRTADPIGIPFNGVVELVPEPGTGTVLIGALAEVIALRRRRR
jgi:hypothetical protein